MLFDLLNRLAMLLLAPRPISSAEMFQPFQALMLTATSVRSHNFRMVEMLTHLVVNLVTHPAENDQPKASVHSKATFVKVLSPIEPDIETPGEAVTGLNTYFHKPFSDWPFANTKQEFQAQRVWPAPPETNQSRWPIDSGGNIRIHRTSMFVVQGSPDSPR